MESEKEKIKERFNGWNTPQINSCFEPLVIAQTLMAQTLIAQTFLNNILMMKVGLLNTEVKVGENMYPANIFTTEQIYEVIDKAFLIQKPTKKEKGEYNDHKTVKPITICKYLIKLSTFADDAIILDPFAGSGTTLVAAKMLGQNYIGTDINENYIHIANKRLLNI